MWIIIAVSDFIDVIYEIVCCLMNIKYTLLINMCWRNVKLSFLSLEIYVHLNWLYLQKK